jgi:hypothetical protein
MRHFAAAHVPVAWRKLQSSWSIESSFLNEYRNPAFRCEPSSDSCFHPFTGNASVIVTVAKLFIQVQAVLPRELLHHLPPALFRYNLLQPVIGANLDCIALRGSWLQTD